MLNTKIVSINSTIRKKLKPIESEYGIHARPIKLLGNLSKEMSVDISIQGIDDSGSNKIYKVGDIDDLMIMTIAGQGKTPEIIISGAKASEAFAKFQIMFLSNFGAHPVHSTLGSEITDVSLVKAFNKIHEMYPHADISLVCEDAGKILSKFTSVEELKNEDVLGRGLKISVQSSKAVSIIEEFYNSLGTAVSRGGDIILQQSGETFAEGIAYSSNIIKFHKPSIKELEIETSQNVEKDNYEFLNIFERSINDIKRELKVLREGNGGKDYEIIDDSDNGKRFYSLRTDIQFLEQMPLVGGTSSFVNALAERHNANPEKLVEQIVQEIIAEINAQFGSNPMMIKMIVQMEDFLLNIYDEKGYEIFADFFKQYEEKKSDGPIMYIGDFAHEKLLEFIAKNKSDFAGIRLEETCLEANHIKVLIKNLGVPAAMGIKTSKPKVAYFDTRAVIFDLSVAKNASQRKAVVEILKTCPNLMMINDEGNHLNIFSDMTVKEILADVSKGYKFVGNKTLLYDWMFSNQDSKLSANIAKLVEQLDSFVLSVDTTFTDEWFVDQEDMYNEVHKAKMGLNKLHFKGGEGFDVQYSIVALEQLIKDDAVSHIGLARVSIMLDLYFKENNINLAKLHKEDRITALDKAYELIISELVKKDPSAVIRIPELRPDKKLFAFLKKSGKSMEGVNLVSYNEDYFKPFFKQLILQGAQNVLIPMVNSSKDVLYISNFITRVAFEVALEMGIEPGSEKFAEIMGNAKDLKVGAMYETVDSLSNYKEIAESADFVSVGGNDLKHFVFGETRFGKRSGIKKVLFNPLEMIVLNSLINENKQQDKSCGYCGEFDSKYGYLQAFLLYSMGMSYSTIPSSAMTKLSQKLSQINYMTFDEVSVNIKQLPIVKELNAFVGGMIGDPSIDIFDIDSVDKINKFYKIIKSANTDNKEAFNDLLSKASVKIRNVVDAIIRD